MGGRIIYQASERPDFVLYDFRGKTDDGYEEFACLRGALIHGREGYSTKLKEEMRLVVGEKAQNWAATFSSLSIPFECSLSFPFLFLGIN